MYTKHLKLVPCRKECVRLVCKTCPYITTEVLQDVCSDEDSQRSFPAQVTELLTSSLEIEVSCVFV